MKDLIDAALNHSPAHRQAIARAISSVPGDRLDLMAYAVGSTCKAEGVTDFPNPFPRAQAEGREKWDRWFEAGQRGAKAPEPPEDPRVGQLRATVALQATGLDAGQKMLDEARSVMTGQAETISALTAERDLAQGAAKDLEAAVALADEEIAALKARVAELEGEIEVLNKALAANGAGTVSDAVKAAAK